MVVFVAKNAAPVPSDVAVDVDPFPTDAASRGWEDQAFDDVRPSGTSPHICLPPPTITIMPSLIIICAVSIT